MVSLFLASLAGSLGAWAAERSTEGLLALYDFSLVKGGSVKDRSGVGQPLDLRIENLRNVRRAEGSLEVRGQTLIRSDKPATKIIEAVRRTGEFTVEAWLRTGRLNQDGPARIVTISSNSTNRNFTLGQEGNEFDVRFRTSDTSNNGLPSLGSSARSLSLKLTHVVYTRGKGGQARLFINGKPSAKKTVSGKPMNWDKSYLSLIHI